MDKFRVDVRIRHRGKQFFDWFESKSEDFDDDQEFCMAIASELLEILRQEREGMEDGSDSDES